MLISSIKPNNDKYQVDELGCFEKPIGIVLDSYNDNLSSAFYMYLKFCKIYLTDHEFFSKYALRFNIIEVSSYIINNFFSLSFKSIECKENFHDFIQDQLIQHNRVLVPGNLKELYYSDFYKSSDWPHLFIITGFDSEKEIYYILDSTHSDSIDVIYKPFVIKYEELEKIYYSYCNVNDENNIFVLSNPNKISQFNIYNIIKSCLDLYQNNLATNPHLIFFIVDSINNIISNTEKSTLKNDIKNNKFGDFDFHEITHDMINQIKYKNVFFTELINSSMKFINNKDFFNYLTEKKEALINKWVSFINLVLVNMRRILTFDYTDFINEIVLLEDEIRLICVDLNTQLLSSTNNFALKKSFYLENNEDSIIDITSNNNILFNFTKSIDYNCWIRDAAPKLYINNSNIPFENFILQNKVTVLDKRDNIGFLAGIVIKFDDNSIYYFGLSSNRTVVIDKKSENFGLAEDIYNNDSIYLKFTIKDKVCTFYYSIDLDKPFNKLFEFSFNNSIAEVGLSCKTWTRHSPLKIEFSDIIFENYS